MPSARPACEIEPVRSTASSRRILPGPIDRLDPKSTRNVSLVSFTAAAPARKQDDTPAVHRALRPLRRTVHWRQRRQQTREAGGPQREVGFVELVAGALGR